MKKDEHFWRNLSLKCISGCQGFRTEIVKYTICCRVSEWWWWCLSKYQTMDQRRWDELPYEQKSILGAMSVAWQCVCEKAVFDRMECHTMGCPMDLKSQFPISGRRTLLLSGKNSRKSCIICCLVNMPWITVSLLFCFYWPLFITLLSKIKLFIVK